MTPSLIEVVDRYDEQFEADAPSYRSQRPQKSRKHRGYGGNRKRTASLGMNGRNGSRSVKRTMK